MASVSAGAALVDLLDQLSTTPGRPRLAAGHQAAVDDDGLIDPLGTGVFKIRLDRVVGGQFATVNHLRVDQCLAPWQIAPTGLPWSKKARTKASTRDCAGGCPGSARAREEERIVFFGSAAQGARQSEMRCPIR